MLTLLRPLLTCFVFGALLLNVACTHYAEPFIPPHERSKPENETAWRENTYLVIAWHDVEDADPDQRFLSVSTAHLQQQFSWLKTAGYTPVSVDQILAAKNQGPALPPKAVLLTFDDGYVSFYERVYPLLQAYQWPAVLAPVGKWLDTPANQMVDFGGEPVARDRFLTWEQVAEMSRSGLVEIGAHSYDLHYGHIANPQGNTQPVAASRHYNLATQQYETTEQFTQRIALDIERITSKIKAVTGTAPRVWIWPYGRASGLALSELQKAGYEMAMTLEDGLAHVAEPLNTPRLLINKNPSTVDFSNYMVAAERAPAKRLVHVDLDYIYDPDPEQTERNLDTLVQRIADMRIPIVALQAFADPEGDGLIKSVYFPNQVLPMRADLFNRVAWQLRSRADVRVYAWMPVLGFDLADDITRVHRYDPDTQSSIVSDEPYRRISPFDEQGREQIKQLYADLASYSLFNGLLFHDDAVLSDFEDNSPAALAHYASLGLPSDIAEIRADPDMYQHWSRYKTQFLNDFTLELAAEVKAISGPHIPTARNLFVLPILQPESEQWFAQNVDDFLDLYDYTIPMVMPRMEGVAKRDEDQWIRHVVAEVAKRPNGLEKTIFEIQARDWSAPPEKQHIPTRTLVHWMEVLQRAGARHFGYYPDDFLLNQPNLHEIRPAISNEWFPFKQ